MEAKHNFFCLGPSWSFQDLSFQAQGSTNIKTIALSLQLLAPKIGD